MLQLDSKALHQKDTKANLSPFLMGWTQLFLKKSCGFAFGSPLFFIRRNSFVEIKGWVNPALSKERASPF